MPEQSPQLALALVRASARFIGAVGWPVVKHTTDILLSGEGGKILPLPAQNITAATAVIDGVGLVDARLNPRLGHLVRAAGWPCGYDNITVSYTAGWDETEIPGDIQDAVLEHAGHIVDNLGLMEQETTGPFTERYSSAAINGVTQKWSDAVERYRVGVGDRS